MEQDLEKLKKELERLKTLVYYDHLTGVLNRLGFKEETEKVLRTVSFGKTTIERRIGHQIPFSVLFTDIDDFKKINDIYGHQSGDTVLKEVSHILYQCLRGSDILARWGGEEFVAALLGADLKSAQKVAEKLRNEIEKKEILIDGKTIKATVSVGMASYGNENSLEEIIHKADQAMYEAKRQGKNRVFAAVGGE